MPRPLKIQPMPMTNEMFIYAINNTTPERRPRLYMMWDIFRGVNLTRKELAERYHVGLGQAYRWIRCYNEKGIDALISMPIKRRGRPVMLTDTSIDSTISGARDQFQSFHGRHPSCVELYRLLKAQYEFNFSYSFLVKAVRRRNLLGSKQDARKSGDPWISKQAEFLSKVYEKLLINGPTGKRTDSDQPSRNALMSSPFTWLAMGSRHAVVDR
jgi:transposase